MNLVRALILKKKFKNDDIISGQRVYIYTSDFTRIQSAYAKVESDQSCSSFFFSIFVFRPHLSLLIIGGRLKNVIKIDKTIIK